MKKRISVALSFLMLLCVLTCTAVAYAEGDELAQVTGLKSGGTTATAITVKWDETENAEGYYVSLYKPETKKEAHYTTTDTTYKAVKLRWSTKYTFKVRAYKTVDGVKTYGEYSEALKISTKDVVAKPAVSGYCNLTSKPVVTWKKAKSAKKYVVYRSTKKDKGYKKIATLGEKARSYTDKSAKVHKTYYYKVHRLADGLLVLLRLFHTEHIRKLHDGRPTHLTAGRDILRKPIGICGRLIVSPHRIQIAVNDLLIDADVGFFALHESDRNGDLRLTACDTGLHEGLEFLL